MYGSVEKYIVRFGRRLIPGGVGPGAWAGKPTEFLDAGSAIVTNAAKPVQNTLNDTADAIKIAGTKHAPVTAIALAPDSPIAEVDLYISGSSQSHRVSIASPFVGCIDRDAHVLVCPVRVMPAIHKIHPTETITIAQYSAWGVPWEMVTTERFTALGLDAIAPHPIAKINVYRGAVSIGAVTRRAGYHASTMWRVWLDGAVNSKPSLIVVTDGRRRVRVQASRLDVASGGAAATIRIYGVEGFKSADGMSPTVSDGRIDLPSFDELLPATALADDPDVPTIFDYMGNPYFAFVATIEGDAGAKGMLQISAWDD